MSRRLLLLTLISVSSCLGSPDTETSDHELVQGAPLIVATTINAPISGGRYQLLAGKQYTAAVTVDAGTITYLTRVQSNALPTSFTINESPVYKDDTVIAYAGHHVYTFRFTPSAAGNFQLAFEIQDRGTGNIYDHDGGVAVTVSTALTAPRIASTTINAPIWNGRYQLATGQTYTVTVVAAMGNVTYTARVDPDNVSSTLQLWQGTTTYQSMPRFGADQPYTFTVTPTSQGNYQVGFLFHDVPPPTGTGNPFNADPGVAVTVVDSTWPRITSTTIRGVTPNSAGEYVLTIGQRYDVVVHVVPGSVLHKVAVEQNDQLVPPVSANLHNVRTTSVPFSQPYDFHFTIVPGYQPTDPTPYPIAFRLGDCATDDQSPPPAGCTGGAFGYDGGIAVVAAAPLVPQLGGLYGYVTRASDHTPLSGAKVQYDTGATVFTSSTGLYSFPIPPSGQHVITITMPGGGYAQTLVTHLTVPAPGMRVDADLEEPFTTLSSVGMTYTRYLDYLRGRTLYHVVRIPPARTTSAIMVSQSDPYESTVGIASRLAPIAKATINGGQFDFGGIHDDGTPCRGPLTQTSFGYLYTGSYYVSCELGASTTDPTTYPTLGITGTGTNQAIQMAWRSGGFATPDWVPFFPDWPLWDANHDHVSDVTYALQSPPDLVKNGPNGPVVTRSDDGPTEADADAYWARTAIGLGTYAGGTSTSNDLFFVVADGEGLSACQGANFYVLATFMRDVLTIENAMDLDGGGSTSMALYRDSSHAVGLVNTPTSENLNSLDSPTVPPKVFDFVLAW